MIYVKLDEMENNLETVKDGLMEYEQDRHFASGYDTAVDVATCANASTIWHKPDEDNMPEGKVLIYVPGEGIYIGWWGCSNWNVPGFGLVLAKDVAAWCELPDWPEDL